jgi:hypothetical protein
MTFDDVWTSVSLDTVLTVSNSIPPPSTNTEGMAYRAWRSHNFEGVLREKVTHAGWRSLRIEVIDTPAEVEFLAYDVADDGQHTFEVTP